ncbi:MAG: helix-turn-helix transcriptional regulator [Acetatifactor sp.]|nr:helix-turn-helix transcriptional regulator [Acetatifactor sp.]
MLELYKNIRELRLNCGLSQNELAKKVGYKDRSSIAKVEAGVVDIPQSQIKAFADALGVTPGELMGWDEELSNKASLSASIYNDEDSSFIKKYHQLTPDNKDFINNMVDKLLSTQ